MSTDRHRLPRGWGLTVHSDPIEVTSMMASADPNWKYTDAAGHEHYYDHSTYPTLAWVVTDTYWCQECRDEHEEGHHECPLCGEQITPGVKLPSGRREFIPGQETVILHGFGHEIALSPEEVTDLRSRGMVAAEEIIEQRGIRIYDRP